MDGAVRIALVGCGAMGAIVARDVYAVAPADGPYRVTAVVDPRPERARELAELLGATPYESLAAASEAGTPIDAVDLRVPHGVHRDAGLDALQRGVHLLVEKPIARTLGEAKELVEAARARGLVGAVAENYPHMVAVRAGQAAMAAGDLGAVRALRTTRCFTLGGLWTRDGWRQDGGAQSGLLLDQGTHHTSLLRCLGGPITEVAAVHSGDPSDQQGETLLVTSRFASGLAAQSLYTWGGADLSDTPEAAVIGSAAHLEIRVDYEGDAGGAFLIEGSNAAARRISPAEGYYDSHRSMIEDWVGSIREGRDPIVTLESGLADLAVVEAAGVSLQEDGRFVAVYQSTSD